MSKNKEPFFITGTNYLSTLNLNDNIEFFNSMRDMWEGKEESFIQNTKGELTTMRHTLQFLVTILQKQLRSSVFFSTQ